MQARKSAKLVSDDMAEKIRQVLAFKRDDIVRADFDSSQSEMQTLKEWVKVQKSLRMPVDGISDEFKLKVAKSLIRMFGDKILIELYFHESGLREIEACEKMLDEILFELHVAIVASLKDGDQFGEQAVIKDCIRTASVRCMEDTHLCYISKKDFDRLYESIKKAKMDRRV